MPAHFLPDDPEWEVCQWHIDQDGQWDSPQECRKTHEQCVSRKEHFNYEDSEEGCIKKELLVPVPLEDQPGENQGVAQVEKQEGQAIFAEIGETKSAGGPKVHDDPQQDTYKEILPGDLMINQFFQGFTLGINMS
jgi:hypothetical protein